MSAVTRRTGPGLAEVLAFALLLLAVLAAAAVWSVAAFFNGEGLDLVNPVAAITEGAPWTPAHTAAAVLLAVVWAAIVAAVIVASRKTDRAREDRAAIHMGRGKSIAAMQRPSLDKLHKRLGLDPKTARGVFLGYAVAGGQLLRASFESTVTVIAGPRRQKSRAIVIPNILDAPGTVITTSVRSDVVDATIVYRSSLGPVAVFDPQGNAPQYAGFGVWWNPLAGIRTMEDAADLAGVLLGQRDTSTDGWFHDRGAAVLSQYLFAAADAGHYLPKVLEWLTRDDSPAPVRILMEKDPMTAMLVNATQEVNDKTRSSIFTVARGAVEFLGSAQLRAWVQPGEGRREFHPAEFVTEPHATLYLLSKDNKGNAGPLVSALTKTLLDSAERYAEQQHNQRMPVPLMAILDEAGNICRIPDLPERYSHYGGRGIIVVTILQSESQGDKVWPNGGFGMLWEASTVQVFAGGNAKNSFLRDLSERIGTYQYNESTRSNGPGGSSRQHSRPSESIMDTRDVDSLSLGRMIVFAAGCQPTLVRMRPFDKDKRFRTLAAMTPTNESVGSAANV